MMCTMFLSQANWLPFRCDVLYCSWPQPTPTRLFRQALTARMSKSSSTKEKSAAKPKASAARSQATPAQPKSGVKPGTAANSGAPARPRSRTSRSPKPPSIWIVIGILLFLLVGYLQQQGYIDLADLDAWLDDSTASPAPLVYEGEGAGSIQAFFTTPWLIYPDRPARRTPPPHERAIIADIDAAYNSVDMAVFEYNLISIAEALVRAKERGVAVRLALDRENLEKVEMAEWAGIVQQAGIPVSWQETTAFLHSKFVIIDNSLVWMGSWNATNNDTYRNNNNLLRITMPPLVENYVAEFEQMFDGMFGNAKSSLAPNPVIEVDGVLIENYFSPQDRQLSRLVEWVNSARSSIHFMAFAFTSPEIAQAMLDRHADGVLVQGVFEQRNAGGTGAEFENLRRGGVDVLMDGNCYTMHHKVIIVDEHTVITGSYNFTRRAEETNDENLLIIDDPELAGQFMEEFERVFEQARNPMRCEA